MQGPQLMACTSPGSVTRLAVPWEQRDPQAPANTYQQLLVMGSKQANENAQTRLASVEKRLRKAETACEALASVIGAPPLSLKPKKIKALKKKPTRHHSEALTGIDSRIVHVPKVQTIKVCG